MSKQKEVPIRLKSLLKAYQNDKTPQITKDLLLILFPELKIKKTKLKGYSNVIYGDAKRGYRKYSIVGDNGEIILTCKIQNKHSGSYGHISIMYIPVKFLDKLKYFEEEQ